MMIQQPSPEAVAVMQTDFAPVARAIRDLIREKDFSFGPSIGGALFYVVCTMQDVQVESTDALLVAVKDIVLSIAQGRANELIEGN